MLKVMIEGLNGQTKSLNLVTYLVRAFIPSCLHWVTETSPNCATSLVSSVEARRKPISLLP